MGFVRSLSQAGPAQMTMCSGSTCAPTESDDSPFSE